MNSSQAAALPSKSSTSIFLRIRGIGSVVSFKNKKMITRGRLITDPAKQRWMQSAVDQLASQLLGLYPILADETLGEWRKRLQTAQWQLLDDSLAHMLPGEQNVERVPKGDEGCLIKIDFP